MKRTIFNAFRAAACAAVAVIMSSAVTGCGSKNDEPDVVKDLKVSTSNLNLDGKASTGTVEVTATGVNWTAAAKDSWVTVSPAIGNANATVTVAAEANPNQTDRFTTVTFSAEGVPSVNVTVLQYAAPDPEPEPEPEPDPDQNKTMQYAQFVYYGDAFNTQGQVDVVVLSLIDKEVVNNEVELPFDEVDFALAFPYKGSADAIKSLLFGTFEGKAAKSLNLPCFVLEVSGYNYIYGENKGDEYEYPAQSGTVTVSSTSNGVKIDFDLKLEGGRTYKGTYTGQAVFADGTQSGGGGTTAETTTLTSDYTPVMTLIDQADIYSNENGFAQFVCEFAGTNAAGTTDYMFMNILVNSSATTTKNVAGTYTVIPLSSETVKAGDVIPGYFRQQNNNTYFAGSWYLNANAKDEITGYAALREGTITVSQDGGNLTVAVDCKDEAGHAIKGSGTAAVSFRIDPTSTSSVMSTRYAVKMPKAKGTEFFVNAPALPLRSRAF